MPWIKRILRGNKVFARVDEDGELSKNDKGLVEVVYKLSANAKIYNASAANLMPTGKAEDDKPFQSADAPGPGGNADAPLETTASKKSPAGGSQGLAPGTSKDAIIIYTDGACSMNPGPMGIGAVIIDGDKRLEISEFLGTGTNNIAELTAIEVALRGVGRTTRPVRIYTDSQYAIGVLTKGWRAKANLSLIARLRERLATFGDVGFIYVRGHTGIELNERADALAVEAVRTQQDAGPPLPE
jgi:ribonuclease HI